MSDERAAPQVYQLTHLTRTSNRERRVVIQTFDVSYRLVAISVFGIVIGLLPAAVLAAVFGPVGVLVIPALCAGLYFLLEYRMRSGMNLTAWKHLRDRHIAQTGQLFLCGEPVDPLAFHPGVLVPNTVSLNRPTPDGESESVDP